MENIKPIKALEIDLEESCDSISIHTDKLILYRKKCNPKFKIIPLPHEGLWMVFEVHNKMKLVVVDGGNQIKL